MDSNLLTTGTNSGTQTSTQSPQTAGKPSSSAANSSGVQTGTAASLLNSDSGVPLSATPLTTVNINGKAGTTTNSTVATTTAAKHQVNPALVGITGLFIIIAVISFLAISRSAKNTT
jgi:hypothetical protein